MPIHTMLDAGVMTSVRHGCCFGHSQGEKKKTHGYGLYPYYTSNRFGLYAKYGDYAAGKLGAISIQ